MRIYNLMGELESQTNLQIDAVFSKKKIILRKLLSVKFFMYCTCTRLYLGLKIHPVFTVCGHMTHFIHVLNMRWMYKIDWREGRGVLKIVL